MSSNGWPTHLSSSRKGQPLTSSKEQDSGDPFGGSGTSGSGTGTGVGTGPSSDRIPFLSNKLSATVNHFNHQYNLWLVENKTKDPLYQQLSDHVSNASRPDKVLENIRKSFAHIARANLEQWNIQFNTARQSLCAETFIETTTLREELSNLLGPGVTDAASASGAVVPANISFRSNSSTSFNKSFASRTSGSSVNNIFRSTITDITEATEPESQAVLNPDQSFHPDRKPWEPNPATVSGPDSNQTTLSPSGRKLFPKDAGETLEVSPGKKPSTTLSVRSSSTRPRPDGSPSRVSLKTRVNAERFSTPGTPTSYGTTDELEDGMRMLAETDMEPERENVSITEVGDEWEHMAVPDSPVQKPNPDPVHAVQVRDRISERLENIWPPMPKCLKAFPFPIAWELVRVALYCGIQVSADTAIRSNPHWTTMEYHEFWESIKQHPLFKNKSLPQPSSDQAWKAAMKTNGYPAWGAVQFTAKAEFVNNSSKPLLHVTLNPITAGLGHRLGRKFGPDRFLELILPPLEYSSIPRQYKQHSDEAISQIEDWLITEHGFLGRTWRVFFAKDATRTNHRRNGEFGSLVASKEPLRRLFLYAEGGYDLSKQPKLNDLSKRPKKLYQVIDWLLQLRNKETNHSQPYLKLFSRISIGISRTRPAVAVERTSIRMKPDVLSPTGKVMNDGCGRISRGLARKICQLLDLDHSPCAFQGRFGPAKGMWIVDVESDDWEVEGDEIWIEIYPSQAKWSCDFEDVEQRTFEVRDFSPSSIQSAEVNTQLLPVLENGAIEKDVMRTCLADLIRISIEAELGEQEEAIHDPVTFLLWVNRLRRPASSRLEASDQDVPFGPLMGGFPDNQNDQMAFMLQSGFHPMKQKFLQELAKKARLDHCSRMSQELKFKVGCSAYLFMLADIWGYLNEGEIHLCFSEAFKGDQGFSDTMVDGQDVLVARSPAHLPSDVQRVKAVFCRELRKLKNVVVFSTKGNEPLADKLSGGDYDGDLAWVCWDGRIVKKFRSTPVPDCPDFSQWLKKDKGTYGGLVKAAELKTSDHGRQHKRAITEMVDRGMRFNCRGGLLGRATVYKEQVCYARDTISDGQAIALSHLLGQLVDQPKQGIIFSSLEWARFRKDNGFPDPDDLPTLAYKKDLEWRGKKHPPSHINDYLKFAVAKPVINAGMAKLVEMLDQSGSVYLDSGLTLWHDRLESLAQEHSQMKQVFEDLKRKIYDIQRKWNDARFNRGPDWQTGVRTLHWEFRSISPPSSLDGLAAVLLCDLGLPDSDSQTLWSFFRASTLFKLCCGKPSATKFAFYMCGLELGDMKAKQSGPSIRITGKAHGVLKMDRRAVARVTGNLVGGLFWGADGGS